MQTSGYAGSQFPGGGGGGVAHPDHAALPNSLTEQNA